MSMIHVTRIQNRSYLIVDNTAKQSGFGSGSTAQSEQELRSALTTKKVQEEQIERHLAQLEITGDISILI